VWHTQLHYIFSWCKTTVSWSIEIMYTSVSENNIYDVVFEIFSRTTVKEKKLITGPKKTKPRRNLSYILLGLGLRALNFVKETLQTSKKTNLPRNKSNDCLTVWSWLSCYFLTILHFIYRKKIFCPNKDHSTRNSNILDRLELSSPYCAKKILQPSRKLNLERNQTHDVLTVCPSICVVFTETYTLLQEEILTVKIRKIKIRILFH
jgi:hypothetical protein